MAIKPIIAIQHRGRRVRVEFSKQPGISVRYDIIVNEKPIKVGLFAEEVIRWLGDAMHQEP
jgi:hypothetical protein